MPEDLVKGVFGLPHVGLGRHAPKARATAQGNEEFDLFPDFLQDVLVLGVADAAGDDAHHGLGNVHGRPIPQLPIILMIY